MYNTSSGTECATNEKGRLGLDECDSIFGIGAVFLFTATLIFDLHYSQSPIKLVTGRFYMSEKWPEIEAPRRLIKSLQR
jgi:hypothetical protein